MDYKQPSTEQTLCPNCKGGNPPNAQRCMWCGAMLKAPQQYTPQYTPPPIHPAEMPKPATSRMVPALIGLVFVIVLGAVLFFVLGRPADSGARYKMNEPISIARWRVTVERTELVPELVWNSAGDKQAASGQYLKVYLTIENVINEAGTLATSDYTILDSKTGIFAHCNLPACLAYPEREQRLSLNKELGPNVTGKALAIFDIPRDSSGLKLEIRGPMERDKFLVGLDR